MLDINGTWLASYSALTSPVGNPDPEEAAELELKDGRILGQDPFGGMYEGEYTIEGEEWKAQITVKQYDSIAITVFEGVSFPLSIVAAGHYRSPNYFSGQGTVNGIHEIVFNCRRK